jgi:hypothetical protein
MDHNLGVVLLATGLVCSLVAAWTPFNSRIWFGGIALAAGFAYMLFGR